MPSHIAEQLRKKLPADKQEDTWESLAQEFPWYPMVHWLQAFDQPQSEEALQKAAIYSPEVLRLHGWLHSQTAFPFFVAETSPSEMPPADPIITDDLPTTPEELNNEQAFFPEGIATVPLEEGFAESTPEEQVEISSDNPNKETDTETKVWPNDKESTEPGEVPVDESEIPAEGLNDIITIESYSETIEEEEPYPPPPPPPAELTAEVPEKEATDHNIGQKPDESFVPTSEEVVTEPLILPEHEVVIDLSGMESEEFPPESEENLEAEEEEDENAPALPAFKLPDLKLAADDLTKGEQALLSPIEPFHTVDYFASQGIKAGKSITTETVQKIDHQVRSFTEWLRSMKKVGYQTDPTYTDPLVDTNALNSIQKEAVVTETMAEIWLKQGNKGQAIDVFDKLMLLYPEKSHYFAARIKAIKEKQ